MPHVTFIHGFANKPPATVVGDIAVQNDGAWRHSIAKSLRRPRLCGPA